MGHVLGTASGCKVNNVSSSGGFNGQWVQYKVPVPDNYTCNYNNANGCWVRVNFNFPSQTSVSDTTTWSATIEGDPVRLVEWPGTDAGRAPARMARRRPSAAEARARGPRCSNGRVPWCDACDRFLSPPTVKVDGTCPTAGALVDPGAPTRRCPCRRRARPDRTTTRSSRRSRGT